MAFDRTYRPISDAAKQFHPTDPTIYRHLPWLTELDDETVIARDGAIMTTVFVQGIDSNTSSADERTDLRRQLAEILDRLDDRFTVYLHRFMRPVSLNLAPMPTQGSFAADVDAAWKKALDQRNLHEFTLALTLVRVPQGKIPLPFLGFASKKVAPEALAERRNELCEVLSILESAFRVRTTRLKISDGSLIGFYATLLCGSYRPEARGCFTLISEDAANVMTDFGNGTISFDLGDRYAAVLWVKKYPTYTTPGALDALDLDERVIVSHSYTPLAKETIIGRAKRRLQQMLSTEDMAISIREGLQDSVDAVESGQIGFGEHQMSVTVFADNPHELDRRVSNVTGAAAQAGIVLTREKIALEGTFFANFPGNMDYRCRSMVVSSLTFADCASLHGSDTGTPAQQLPWKTPLTILQSSGGTAHRFSFHPPGSPDEEPTNGHSLILGPSFAGKTTTAMFLALQVARIGGRLIALDKGRALHMPITALGGQYAAVMAGRPTGLNPLATETGARGRAFLLEWFSRLLESTGPVLTPRQSEMLAEAVRKNGNAKDELRNFKNFLSLIGDANDNRDLAMRVAEWAPGGRYGWVFEQADQPLIDFRANPVTAIDLTEILKLSTERTALLGYLFRSIEMLMEDKLPTIILVDEAWQVLDDDYFAKTLSEWLVTARKQQVVVLMMTQFPSQIRQSKAQTILEGLPNQLLFPNRRANDDDYDGYGLTDGEMSFLLGGQSNGRRALWRGEQGSSTVLDVDLSALGSLLTVLGGGKAGIKRFGEDYAARPNFWKDAP